MWFPILIEAYMYMVMPVDGKWVKIYVLYVHETIITVLGDASQ